MLQWPSKSRTCLRNTTFDEPRCALASKIVETHRREFSLFARQLPGRPKALHDTATLPQKDKPIIWQRLTVRAHTEPFEQRAEPSRSNRDDAPFLALRDFWSNVNQLSLPIDVSELET